MFSKKISVHPTEAHGLGLLADENTQKDAVTYTKDAVAYTKVPELDLFLGKKEYERLHPNGQAFIAHCGHFDKQLDR